MVTIARRFARPISLIILWLFATGPGIVWADPRPDPATDQAVAVPAAGPDRTSADLLSVAGFRPADHAPLWLDASAPAPAKTGSWWSRRTTAQKTWFIVGMVVGAYGIYAIASNGSNDDGGSGGGGY